MVRKHNAPLNPLSSVSLVAGLGNPGEEYEQTYHNVGFIVADIIRGHGPYAVSRTGTFAESAAGHMRFVKPLTFMNDSGRGVGDALRYFRKKPDALVVIHDDADIPVGEYKVQFARGAAGHHGIESIIRVLKTNAFWRVRIGIGKQTKNGKKIPASKTVLGTITKPDLRRFEAIAEEIRGVIR
jgi:PTH1 family peptidyl-tRNA hydrolase